MANIPLTRGIVQRIRTALHTRTPWRTDGRIDELLLWAIRLPERIDAAVAAIQTLRDLGEITKPEAVYLLDSLIELPRDNRELDPGIEKLIAESPEQHELAMAALSHHDMTMGVAFFRAHGEEELAKMYEHDPDGYSTLCAEGSESLIGYKELHHPRPPKDGLSEDPALVMEKLLALSATEGIREWLAKWNEFVPTLKTVTPEAAIRAVQSARELGAISFEQSVALVHDLSSELYWEEAELDREYHRLSEQLAKLEARLGIKVGTPEAERPLEWQVLNAQLERRRAGILAVVLRRVGEHRMANLVVDDPAEYERMRQIHVGEV